MLHWKNIACSLRRHRGSEEKQASVRLTVASFTVFRCPLACLRCHLATLNRYAAKVADPPPPSVVNWVGDDQKKAAEFDAEERRRADRHAAEVKGREEGTAASVYQHVPAQPLLLLLFGTIHS